MEKSHFRWTSFRGAGHTRAATFNQTLGMVPSLPALILFLPH